MTRAGRNHRASSALAASIVAVALFASALVPSALAIGADKAEVVLVLDFSGSILDDATTRNQFGDGARADRRPGRRDLARPHRRRHDDLDRPVRRRRPPTSPAAARSRRSAARRPSRRLSDCLRTVAAEYKKGGDAALTKSIGRDTNYVAAMQAAAAHLPADATRPTMILFTDGKHDVPGVPVSQVQPTRDQPLRQPDAVRAAAGRDGPEGCRAADARGGSRVAQDDQRHAALLDRRDDDVAGRPVFQTPEDAGNAVALALQNATCTFTAAPVATPPALTNAVENINLAPLDGAAAVDWDPPTTPATDPIVSYRVQCTADGGGDPVATTQPASPDNSTVVKGLTNGTAYTCEVAADTATKQGDWTKSDDTVTPAPVPSAPSKPNVTAADRAIKIDAAPGSGPAAAALRYECSSDGGKTWPSTADVQTSADTKAQIGGLKNGTAYVCRATATNDSGTGAPSDRCPTR